MAQAAANATRKIPDEAKMPTSTAAARSAITTD